MKRRGTRRNGKRMSQAEETGESFGEGIQMRTSNWMRRSHVTFGWVVLLAGGVLLALAFYFR